MPPDHCPGPRCESLVDIYSQLQQEVGAAGGELEPKTRAALISRLDEVLQTLVTRYEPLPGLHQILRKEEGQSWGGHQEGPCH